MSDYDEKQGPLEKVSKHTRQTVIRKILGRSGRFIDPIDGQVKYMTAAEAVANALITKALSGDIPAIRETLDSAFGKIPDEIRGSQVTEVIFKWGDQKTTPQLPEAIDGEIIEGDAE